jgi:histone H3/H4
MPPRPDAVGSSLPRSSTSTALSIYPTDSVQDVAESLGLPPLKESVAATLAADVEYRLRQVVQDASKFMKHGKRSQLRVADIDRALKQRNIEPIFPAHTLQQLARLSVEYKHRVDQYMSSTMKRLIWTRSWTAAPKSAWDLEWDGRLTGWQLKASNQLYHRIQSWEQLPLFILVPEIQPLHLFFRAQRTSTEPLLS